MIQINNHIHLIPNILFVLIMVVILVYQLIIKNRLILIREKIPILNFYYGWRPKGTPNFINKKGDGYDFSVLKNVKPKYIISDNNKNFSEYSYYAFLENSKIRIWKTDKSNIFPKL